MMKKMMKILLPVVNVAKLLIEMKMTLLGLTQLMITFAKTVWTTTSYGATFVSHITDAKMGLKFITEMTSGHMNMFVKNVQTTIQQHFGTKNLESISLQIKLNVLL